MDPVLNQKRAALVKELNYLWNNPRLTEQQRSEFLEKLSALLADLK